MREPIEVLKNLFPPLSAEMAAQLVAAARVIRVPDQHVFCEEGACGDIFYVLMDGQVHILKNTASGFRLIDTKFALNFFGEMALLLDQPRAATVRAEGEVTVIEIDREVFDRYIKAVPDLRAILDRRVIQNLLNQQQKILTQELPPPAPDDVTPPDASQMFLSLLFPQLKADAIAELYQLARVAHYPGGVTLCREGEVESVFYVLVAGEVEVFKHTDQGPRRINILRPGEYFGELALIVTQARTSTIVTAGDVTVIEIDRATFDRHIRANEKLFAELNKLGIQRLLRQEQRLAAQLPDTTTKIKWPQIFISYAHADEAFVLKLVDDLSQRGFKMWLDRRAIQAGAAWDAEIEKAMSASQLMLVVLSARSVESSHVADECHYFLEEKKPILPVLYEPCQIPFRLRRLQYINFADVEYAKAFQQLSAEIQAYLEKI